MFSACIGTRVPWQSMWMDWGLEKQFDGQTTRMQRDRARVCANFVERGERRIVKFYDVGNFSHDFSLFGPIICHIKYTVTIEHRKNNIIIINLVLANGAKVASENGSRINLYTPIVFYFRLRSWNPIRSPLRFNELHGEHDTNDHTQCMHTHTNTMRNLSNGQICNELLLVFGAQYFLLSFLFRRALWPNFNWYFYALLCWKPIVSPFAGAFCVCVVSERQSMQGDECKQTTRYATVVAYFGGEAMRQGDKRQCQRSYKRSKATGISSVGHKKCIMRNILVMKTIYFCFW